LETHVLMADKGLPEAAKAVEAAEPTGVPQTTSSVVEEKPNQIGDEAEEAIRYLRGWRLGFILAAFVSLWNRRRLC
jgi:hypothetical protein